MREFWIALVLCWCVADVVKTVTPIGSVLAQPEPIRIVTVSVCAPKDNDRVVPGMMIPRLVTTEKIIAANIAPEIQAAETRTKRRR